MAYPDFLIIDVQRLAAEIDKASFTSALDRLHAVYPLLPEECQISDDYLHSIEFVTPDRFFQENLSDLLDAGYDVEDATAQAKKRAETHIVSFLDTSGRIIAKPIPDLSGVGGPLHKVEFYMSLIANSYARAVTRRTGDIQLTDVAEVIGLDTDETQEMMLRNLHHDPYVFAQFVHEKTGVEVETFFDQFYATVPEPTPLDRVDYLRSRLRNGYAVVLVETNMDIEEYHAHVANVLENHVTATIEGRIVELSMITGEGRRFALGEMAQSRDYVLGELHADTFAMYALFLDYVRGQGKKFAKLPEVEKLKRFKSSSVFRETFVSCDYLTNFALVDLAIASDGFNHAFLALHQANGLEYSPKKISDRAAGALRQCVDAYQAKNIMGYLFGLSLVDPAYYKRLGIASLDTILASRQPGENVALTQPLRVAVAALATGEYPGVYEAASGGLSKNEHVIWKTDTGQPEARRSGDILGLLRGRLHELDVVKNPDRDLVAKSVAYTRRVVEFVSNGKK